jgi:magnesium-transporting ATPase (P-type)
MTGLSEWIMASLSFKPARDNLDPVITHAYREAVVVLVVWLMGIAWTVGYCAMTGYNVPPEQIRITLGMPNWVFWGILVPWILIILFTIWFGLFYIVDDELVQGQHESERGHFHNSPPPETDEVSQ